MKIRDNKPVRLTIAVVSVALLWLIVGSLGPLVYWTKLTPVWNEESVVHLRSFLALRTIAFAAVGLAVVYLACCALIKNLRFRTFLVSTGLCAFLMTTSILFFIPEWSPIHILYREFPSTNYRDGFSPRQFLRLSLGMTKVQVEEAIGFGGVSFWAGAPTRESTTWMYSGPGGENHWRYWLRFNDDGILTERDVEYWWD